jgi:hypothetical protein
VVMIGFCCCCRLTCELCLVYRWMRGKVAGSTISLYECLTPERYARFLRQHGDTSVSSMVCMSARMRSTENSKCLDSHTLHLQTPELQERCLKAGVRADPGWWPDFAPVMPHVSPLSAYSRNPAHRRVVGLLLFSTDCHTMRQLSACFGLVLCSR